LTNGDFKRAVVMKFVREVTTSQIRDAWRESLKGAGSGAEPWIDYFNDIHAGQECVISWVPGVGLETQVAGVDETPVNDKTFASAVFDISLGDSFVQQDIKKDLVARAPELLK
jgi:Chalcone isomerase-like